MVGLSRCLRQTALTAEPKSAWALKQMASSEPPTPSSQKNALSVRCRKNLGSPTHTWKTNILSFYIEQLNMVWEEKYCNPLRNKFKMSRLKCFSPPPPPSHTTIYPINLRTFLTRPLRSHNQFFTNFLTGRFGWDGNHADLELILLASMARSSGKGI